MSGIATRGDAYAVDDSGGDDSPDVLALAMGAEAEAVRSGIDDGMVCSIDFQGVDSHGGTGVLQGETA